MASLESLVRSKKSQVDLCILSFGKGEHPKARQSKTVNRQAQGPVKRSPDGFAKII